MKLTSKIVIFVLAIFTSMASAHAQSPREQLTQMVEQLQKTPTDNALREKIIKLAQEVKPPQAIPPEAKRAFVMGGTYQKEAKSPEDFGLAVKAFQDATAAAPWWGDAYYNLSVALESAKRYDEAKGALTLYLLTQPKDAEQAQERLYAIDAKKVLAAKEAAAATAKEAARVAAERERLRPTVEGKWSNTWGYSFQVVRNGSQFSIIGGNQAGIKQPSTWRAQEVVADWHTIRFLPVSDNPGVRNYPIELSLSADGSKLEGSFLNPDGGKTPMPAFTRMP